MVSNGQVIHSHNKVSTPQEITLVINEIFHFKSHFKIALTVIFLFRVIIIVADSSSLNIGKYKQLHRKGDDLVIE